ncbi:hypothetical protein [Methylobrevis pamukkalensis]|uniref:Uncharacterized protein n=1 Tax=Methylobrevis pamukkalensis TaxID=1439726 RepID=A0A1E3H1B1_9HYPH|nr:hypothetical protein [Methylobrevis pamukkalensis]ODN70118.1 hypothetical protein A6302_02597 [Methylobrevis pamukkalensis]
MTTNDRLHGDIERGKTKDKVPFADPAAAPLGTDDEAAGHPVDKAAGAARPQAGAEPGRDPVDTPPGSAVSDERSRRIDGELLPSAKRRVRTKLAVFVAILVGVGAVVIAIVALQT